MGFQSCRRRPVAVDAGVLVTSSFSITGATVTITNFMAGDVLSFTSNGIITGSFNATTGVLTLTGVDSALDYQTVLRSVTFDSTSKKPNTTPRVIAFAATNVFGTSAVASRTVDVSRHHHHHHHHPLHARDQVAGGGANPAADPGHHDGYHANNEIWFVHTDNTIWRLDGRT
jgi:hypothetical protein